MSDKWFLRLDAKPNPRLRVFCFPYAGGNAAIFSSWAKNMLPGVELVAIQPPGRSNRMIESLYSEMQPLVEDLKSAFQRFTDTPFVFFGHSLGSRVAFELAKQLIIENKRSPDHFIASGSAAPHLMRESCKAHTLPKAEFLARVKSLNGTPEELLNNPEIMDMLLPMLRADFKIASEYRSNTFKISCPISVLYGTRDSISKSNVEAWKDLTHDYQGATPIDGDHFFLTSNPQTTIECLNSVCRKTLQANLHIEPKKA
ncbi:Linear gramicidin dehydrogenase LgrE [Pseudoalteromonas sp. P1-9]|uniref:thioesterase II family protein n=1 Tax=Pseudoalteromonas sp. P1-9 TaxID=1710354 RepID=UPI0006D6153E|nr:thioesterase domain-containing protein [Pseudoalteromonas sp. P1-9]KPV93758.1 Linear gramicidin dehydrogenase LgrE [Pseudoalteromonas sp. P1-9]